MQRASTVGLAMLVLCASSSWAVPPAPQLEVPMWRPGETPDHGPHLRATPARDDTIWFGGDDGNGVAVEGPAEYWDFEDGVQGCWSVDMTDNPGDYFQWVDAATFMTHGDPETPMLATAGVGQVWCGIHQDEANERDFAGGMGYQNTMCQRTFSPEFPVSAGEAPTFVFDYFNHTEPDYDFTYVYILGYDEYGDVAVEEELAAFDGANGNELDPWTTPILDEIVAVGAGLLDGMISFQFEIRMKSDGLWSDEDGLWDTPGGPFAFDNAEITYTGGTEAFDFESGPQGWTFERCAGYGAYMHVIEQDDYEEWLTFLGLACGCTLSGRAMNFCGTLDPSNYDALVVHQHEMFHTGKVPRGTWQPPAWNAAVAEWDAYVNFPQRTGAHYRPGYKIFPYMTEVNLTPHWSPRQGQVRWFFTSDPYCGLNRYNLSTLGGEQGEPLPAAWDSLQFCYEILCSCDAFGTPASVCTEEGWTIGAPTIDNLRIGLLGAPDAPPIAWMSGGLIADGFGQNFPSYLEPSDRCNFNASYNLSMNNPDRNDWQADTTAVTGPIVLSEEGRWLAEFCFHIARRGARQDMIPEYINWKSRLSEDPEDGFVAVLMDSCETSSVHLHQFCTYIHESDPAFNPAHPDQCEENEIIPDGMLVPGTRIEYYARSYWYNGGAAPTTYYYLANQEEPQEVEFLPNMQLRSESGYQVEWPCILYIDGFNRGAGQYITAVLEALQLDYDKFDYQDASSNHCAAMKRTFGLQAYNPLGYGNNGCTPDQLLGYRLILLNTGTFNAGCMHDEDFDMFETWLQTTDCELDQVRRAFIFDGDEVADVILGEAGGNQGFLNNILGVTLEEDPYRDVNNDLAYCVKVESVTGGVFSPAAPGVALYGNGCPQEYDYRVLGVQTGIPGTIGNLRYFSYENTGTNPYVDFAEVVRYNDVGHNWMSIVNGFSMHHLSEVGCSGEVCSNDSACIVSGAFDFLGPALGWLEDPSAPYVNWTYPCTSLGAEEEGEGHLSGPVNHLYQSRPNPFNTRATIRFNLATQGRVDLDVFDVNGRMVKTLVNGDCDGGETTVVWDGTDNAGNRVGGGVFWMQMTTHDGYTSGKKMVVLR